MLFNNISAHIKCAGYFKTLVCLILISDCDIFYLCTGFDTYIPHFLPLSFLLLPYLEELFDQALESLTDGEAI